MFLAFTTIKERSTPDSRLHEYKGRPRVKEGEIGVDERERAWKYDGNKGGGDSGRFDQGRAKSRTVPSLFFEGLATTCRTL